MYLVFYMYSCDLAFALSLSLSLSPVVGIISYKLWKKLVKLQNTLFMIHKTAKNPISYIFHTLRRRA